MTTSTSPLRRLSGFAASFRWAFMPLGLFALVAVGVHAAADLVDDRLLRLVEAVDARLDELFARSDALAAWVTRVESRERTTIARALALAWELAVDALIALPMLGYDEGAEGARLGGSRRDAWRALLARLNQRPTPMRLLRPVLTGVFAIGGAYAVSRLVEGTLFVGLVGDVAPPDVAQAAARALGGVAMALVLLSQAWRAVLRALEHADARCEAVLGASRSAPWRAGWWGTALGLPLAAALVLEAHALLSFVR